MIGNRPFGTWELGGKGQTYQIQERGGRALFLGSGSSEMRTRELWS
jgi:hypothetical protein